MLAGDELTKSAPVGTHGPFLRWPYTGYHHGEVPDEDTYLTHVALEDALLVQGFEATPGSGPAAARQSLGV